MKRFYKIAVATAVSVFCIIGKPVEIKAQIITNDPLVLAQQILQIFQDADMSGWLEGTSSLTSSIEQYDALREKLDDLRSVVDMLSDGSKLVLESISSVEMITSTLNSIDNYKEYFSTADLSNSYVYYQNVCSIRKGFFQVTDELQGDFNNLLLNVQNFKRGEAGNLMQVAGELAEKFNTEVNQFASIAKTRCLTTYEAACRQRENDSARKLFSLMVY